MRTFALAAAAVLLEATAVRGQSATVEVMQSAVVRQPPELPPYRSTALDVAITYSIRRD